MSNFRCIKVAEEMMKCLFGDKKPFGGSLDGSEKQDAVRTRYDICTEKVHADAVKYCGLKPRFLV
jgi:hypothetical protein